MEYLQGKWSLDDLYTSGTSEEFANDTKKISEMAAAFEEHRTELTDAVTPERFREIYAEEEAIVRLAYRLQCFCELEFSGDTQDPQAMARMAQTQAVVTDVSTKTMFFGLWWKNLSDKKAEELIAVCPENEYALRSSRLSKPYTLSEAEERIITIKDLTGAEALTNLYTSITNRYQFSFEKDGEIQKLTRGELMTYAHSEDAALREAAYKELYRIYGDDGAILAQIYQAIVRDWDQENQGLRHFAEPISARNLGNDIPDQVVDLLLQTCRKNRDLFIEYFKLKKKLLGLNEMHRYDLYAPIAENKRQVSFDQALHTVLDSYRNFDPDFADMAKQVYDAGHIDSEVRHGKRSGAFCLTAMPELRPWVLVNFQGREDDISTLAHELGHAIHSISAEDKTIYQQQACLPLAETASTFGEMLLSDYLEQQETDPKVIISRLMKQIDDNYASIQRQAYFALFEKEAHRMIAEGADADELNAAYMENLKEQFGDSMILDDYFKWEWVSIPHIYHTPFYVYAYAFGQLLVLSLYKQYKVEGASFIPRYKEILHKGGSQEPAALLRDAGFDIYSEAFWQGGFDVLREKLNRLKELTAA